MSVDESLALRPGVYSTTSPDGGRMLMAWPHVRSLGRLDADQEAALRRLAEGSHSATEFGGTVADLVAELRDGGWLSVTVVHDGQPLYTVVPLRPPPPVPEKVEPALVLSRFAVLHRDDDRFVIESPRSWCEITVHHHDVLAAVHDDTGLSGEAAERLWQDLRWAELAVPPSDAEETELRLRQWSAHELWFHERSRMGNHGYLGDDFGGTFWARGIFDPVPARPVPYPEPTIDLHRPDLTALAAEDPTMTTILESRQSIRDHDDNTPLTVTQLGEFLYRCARTRDVRTIDGVEHTSRPYPSGGSVYELELYPVVRLVSGLEPGMYHYDSIEHCLRRVRPMSDRAVRRMLRVAGHGSAVGFEPQVLVAVSARVGRIMWKYQAMAYSLILKHVGVLYQTMYCVATAMNLAPCALGGGDSLAFTQATGRDPFEEPCVGEFLLGSRAAGAAA